jgi:hypothetical protein
MKAAQRPVGAPAPAWFHRDPTLEEERRLLWQMTPAERVTAMRPGRLTPRQLSMWASRCTREVPRLNGEFEFIARLTPEVADD